MAPSDQEKIRVCCPACGKPFQVAKQYAGKKAKCTGCQTIIVIPTPATPPPPIDDLSDLLDESYPITSTPLPAKPETVPEATTMANVPVFDPRVEAMEHAYARQRAAKEKNAPHPTAEIFRGIALMGAAAASAFVLVVIGSVIRYIPFGRWLILCIIVGFFMGLWALLKGIYHGLFSRG